MGVTLPVIPAKRYFTIGEVAQLCGVKPHVLRYWEQEFTQLRHLTNREVALDWYGGQRLAHGDALTRRKR